MNMESKDIQGLLPHRYPFLLVDRITELDPGKGATGIKNVVPGEWCLHGQPCYPPALLLESLAQVGGIILGSKARQENPDSRLGGLFAGVSEFEFHRPAEVGEQITLRVALSQSVASIYRFHAEAYVGTEKIAGGQILLSFTQESR